MGRRRNKQSSSTFAGGDDDVDEDACLGACSREVPADAWTTVVTEGIGLRLDAFLTSRVPGDLTRSAVTRAVKGAGVLVNGKASKPSYAVKLNDTISFYIPQREPTFIEPENIPLDIVFEDQDLIVVNKHAGMVVHPAPGLARGTLVNALLHHTGSKALALDDKGVEETNDGHSDDEVVEVTSQLSKMSASDCGGTGIVRPGIVHRIDKNTSGLLLVAKNDWVHAKLAAQFAAHSTKRLYLAIAWGNMCEHGHLETLIARDPANRLRMCVPAKGANGKVAITNYKLREPLGSAASLVEFRLETGRTHQIRVHAKHLGHPLVCDDVYGGNLLAAGSRNARRQAMMSELQKTLGRQALHAHTLGFVHPRTREEMRFESPLPQDMVQAVEILRSDV